ncbi:MAG: HisA/HisF-related TIM barrel protein [Thermoplasmata archaeon]
MPNRDSGSSTPTSTARLVPCLMIRGGRVCLPAEEGPQPALDSSGQSPDILDLADHLASVYKRVYVVDLDGIEHDRPQLDYLQEIAKSGDTWVDAGVRTGDQAIDILVTGAQRAVLSSGRLQSLKELRRAWRLSQDLVFEIEVNHGATDGRPPDFASLPPGTIAEEVRAIGIAELIVSPRGEDVDWAQVRALSVVSPVWVDGSFERTEVSRIAENGAAGGIFHIARELAAWPLPSSTPEPPLS